MNEHSTDEHDDVTRTTENGEEEPIVGDAVDTPEDNAEMAGPDPRDEEIDSLKDQLLRLRAEFDNYRKRTLRENERMRTLAAEGIVRELLPVLDNLELALNFRESNPESLVQGVEMVGRQFQDALAKHGVRAIDSVGRPFDPAIHEAVSQMESDEHPADHVALEYQKGYVLGEQVLRPSKVVVSAGAAGATAGGASDESSSG